MPALREWAEETAAAFTADVGVSLRVDVPEGRRRQFRAVLQLHTAADPALVVEAARLWHEPTETERLLGPRAETATLLALRRGARVWPPLDRLLKDATPDQLRLTDDEAFDLLSDATDTLRAAGIDVHWPRELVKALTATAEIRQRTAPGSSAEGMLDADTLLDFRWQFSLGGEPLTEAEMDALAEARRPLVRLRDQWVLADPKPVARARRRRMEPLTPMEALGAALTGGVERDGETLRCAAVGALGDLVARIRDPESRTPRQRHASEYGDPPRPPMEPRTEDLAAGRSTRVPRRVHLRPVVVADVPGRALVRSGPNADGCRGSHREHPAWHPRDLSQALFTHHSLTCGDSLTPRLGLGGCTQRSKTRMFCIA